VPEITHAFLNKPLGHFVTVKTNPWYYKDSIVLIGDAAHAVMPFYGQGMCAAFDDCLSLMKHLHSSSDYQQAFQKYQSERKIHTDSLATLSVENFEQLRSHSDSSQKILLNKAHTFLHMLLPKYFYPPLYVLVAHGTLPYYDAYMKFKKQEKIMHLLGIGIAIYIISLFYSIYMYCTHAVTRLNEILKLSTYEIITYPIRSASK